MNAPHQQSGHQQRAWAFAGLVQASVLVDRIARGRSTENAAEDVLIEAVFLTDLEEPAQMFGDLVAWRLGLESALALVTRPDRELTDAAKYAMSLIQIEQLLRRRSDVAATLRKELESLGSERRALTRESVLLRLGTIYQRTISTLPRRVHVVGEPAGLKRAEIAAAIRAMLLGGVRCAWLWHSLGGRRWHLILQRTNIRHALHASLEDIKRSRRV